MELIKTTKNIQDFSFSDLDLTFNIHPLKKDLNVNKDLKSVISSMRNLLLTSHYERPFHPEVGSNIKRFLFEHSNFVSLDLIEKEVFDVLTNFEPRVKITKIEAKEDENSFVIMVEIWFYLINSVEEYNIQIPLGRNIIYR